MGASVISNAPRAVRRVDAASAHQLQTGHRLLGTGAVRLLYGETHVNDDPVTGRERLFRQHADVDLALLAGHVDQRELPLVTVQHPDHLTGNPQTHGSAVLSHGCGRRRLQRRDDFLYGPRGPRDGLGHGLGEPDAFLDAARLAPDDDRVGRTATQRPEAGEHRSRIHAVSVDTGCRETGFAVGRHVFLGFPGVVLEDVQRAGVAAAGYHVDQ